MNKQILLDEAIDHINHNNFVKAGTILNELAAKYPNDSEVLHLFGIINYKNNNFELALQYFNEAIKYNPNNYLSFNSIGLIYFYQNKYDESLKYFLKSLEIKPNFAETFFNIANIFIAKQDFQTAITYLLKALEFKKAPEYFQNLVFCIEKTNTLNNYLDLIDKYYQYFTNNFELLFSLSTLFFNNKMIDKAAIFGQLAYKLNATNIKLILNLVVILGELGKYDEAIKIGTEGLKIDKFNDVLHNNIGYTYFLKKEYDIAEKFFDIAIKINPKNYLALFNLGCLFREKHHYHKAIDLFKKAIDINPEYIEAYNNLGIIYNHLAQYNEALDIFEFIITKLPNSAEAWMNLGNCYQYNKLLDKSIEAYYKSIEINPNYASAHKNLSFSYFLKNEYEKAYDEFEWRFSSDNIAKIPLGKKEYNGEKLENKTIVFTYEQGLGDTIQFARYIKIFKEMHNCRAILFCQKPLYNLLKKIKFLDEVHFPTDNLNIFVDYYMPLLSIMKYLNISTNNYYYNTKYIFPDDKNINKFSTFIKYNNKINIGIAWRGNPNHKNDHNRSIPLDIFLQIFDNNINKVNLYSLHIDPTEHEQNIFTAYNIHNTGINFTDFYDTASFIENLNLVICVDTSIAHLAGALGKTVFMLIPYAPDWRWGLYGENNFWYSSMKIFIQNKPKDWSKPFREINYLLNNLG